MSEITARDGISQASQIAISEVSLGGVVQASVSVGQAPPHERQAQRGRRWGWWFYAVQRIWVMKTYWQVVVGFGVLAPVLYLLAMGLGVGTLVDANAGLVAGVTYLVFVGPSLLVTSLVQETVGEFTYSIMGSFVWNRHYYAVAATPISPAQIAVGELVAVSLRMTAQGLAFWLILLVSGGAASPWSWLMVPIGVLASLSFGAPLMAFSATRERDDFSFSFIQRFIVMPMFLFAGTFFPLESMPVYLQWIGWISPMWHGTQLARWVGFGLPLSGGAIVGHLGFLVVLMVVGVWAAIRQYRKRLTR